jgi:phenylalanyl-tRNA synthetase beta chain
LQKPLDTPAAVYLFELEAAALSTGNIPAFTPLSRFPTIRRDIAISVDEATDWQMVKDCVISAVPATLKEVIIFDDYRGKEVETGRKSLALGLILQDYSRTLVDQDVDGIVSDALAALGKELGASLRE